jgi:hypothetical protein
MAKNPNTHSPHKACQLVLEVAINYKGILNKPCPPDTRPTLHPKERMDEWPETPEGLDGHIPDRTNAISVALYKDNRLFDNDKVFPPKSRHLVGPGGNAPVGSQL